MELVVEKSQYELERGKPMPSKNHAVIQSRIQKLIDRKYPDKFEVLPELSLDINAEGREKVPDLAFYNAEDIYFDAENDEIRFKEMPLGVVEIISPTQTLTELIIKSHTFFDAGVKSYWLVIPSLKTIYVFSDKGEYEVYAKTGLLIDNQLGIEIDLGKLFGR
jgi:Uma2 family endonuclease